MITNTTFHLINGKIDIRSLTKSKAIIKMYIDGKVVYVATTIDKVGKNIAKMLARCDDVQKTSVIEDAEMDGFIKCLFRKEVND